MRSLAVFTLSLACTYAAAQDVSFSSKKIIVPKAATIDLATEPGGYEPSLQNLEMPKPGTNSSRAKLMELKKEMREKYPLKHAFAKMDSLAVPTPVLGTNFEGNFAGSSVPNDNDMAISNDGKIVSVINTNIYMFDGDQDTFLMQKALATFAAPLQLFNSKYDPKVIYDPVKDRFIMIILNGYTWQTSKIIVGFSQTNDPTGAWNLYKLSGNPLNDSTWADYPVVGISNEDLYIGINTFTNGSSNNSGFTQSCFWQIDKEEGFNGDTTLTTRYYYDILTNNKPIFNVTPIKGGKTTYGPHFYLLSNRNLSTENDTIFVLKVTGDVHNANTTLQVTTLNSSRKYYLPPTAQQPNGHTFDTNDSRILGGFCQGNTIQFVQSTLDTATGRAGIYHGFINNLDGAMTATANIISDTLLDLGFPNISYTGIDPNETEAIITFNHSASTVFAGFSGIYYGNDQAYSPILRIKEGSSVVNLLSGTYERWGDYSGSQTRYNNPAKVWAVGSFGKSNGKHGTWIAELTSPDSAQHYFPVEPEPVVSEHVYPNPAQDAVSVPFTLEKDMVIRFSVYDMRGRRVAMLLEDKAKEGKNLFTFNTYPLANGIYVLLIETEDGTLIRQERIVKK